MLDQLRYIHAHDYPFVFFRQCLSPCSPHWPETLALVSYHRILLVGITGDSHHTTLALGFLRQSHIIQIRLATNALYSPDWPQTNNLPVSTSLELFMCV